jgi:RimJ/RimL family protein N-acetyltransferase
MALPLELRTDRLLLRRWRAGDRDAFAALNADPVVMEHFPSVSARADSDAAADRIEAHFERHGFGLWAVEVVEVAPFAGFIGLCVPRFEAHFTPCVEIGWRLAAAFWGQEYATEGAKAALAFGFEHLRLDEIVSYTVPPNLRSRRVMEKIGMSHDPGGDFDHPLLPVGHPLSRHVLYRIRRDQSVAEFARIPADTQAIPRNSCEFRYVPQPARR